MMEKIKQNSNYSFNKDRVMIKDKISLKKLKKVSETLLIPLRGRYLETKRHDGIIDDPKSVEIIEALEHDFEIAELPWEGQMAMSARTEILDEATEKFLKENPESIVVNLGCGLCTRAIRVDNGKVLWYDLDLPDCIEIRKEFFQETDRFKFIAKSVLDFTWMDQIEKGKPTLFIAEGLFNYLNEQDVRDIILSIKETFSNSEIIFEAYSSLIKWTGNTHPHIKKAFSMFKWGIGTGKSMEKWGHGIHFLNEWPYVERHPKRWKWMRHFKHIPFMRGLMKVVHLKFNIQDN
jgi:O-methyltransferase involved in polyketide biosynthesis